MGCCLLRAFFTECPPGMLVTWAVLSVLPFSLNGNGGGWNHVQLCSARCTGVEGRRQPDTVGLVQSFRKCSRGRVAAPRVAASGPRLHRLIDVGANEYFSAWRGDASRLAPRSGAPRSKPAQPPRMTRAGLSRLISPPMLAPR